VAVALKRVAVEAIVAVVVAAATAPAAAVTAEVAEATAVAAVGTTGKEEGVRCRVSGVSGTRRLSSYQSRGNLSS